LKGRTQSENHNGFRSRAPVGGRTFRGGQATFEGHWKVHTSIAGSEYDKDCVFTQKEAELTGTCQADQGPASITGSLNDKEKKVNWQFKTEYNGNQLTVIYAGTLDGNKSAGTVNIPEMGLDGDYTATQSN
jgi:hypothetical protein